MKEILESWFYFYWKETAGSMNFLRRDKVWTWMKIKAAKFESWLLHTMYTTTWYNLRNHGAVCNSSDIILITSKTHWNFCRAYDVLTSDNSHPFQEYQNDAFCQLQGSTSLTTNEAKNYWWVELISNTNYAQNYWCQQSFH